MPQFVDAFSLSPRLSWIFDNMLVHFELKKFIFNVFEKKWYLFKCINIICQIKELISSCIITEKQVIKY